MARIIHQRGLEVARDNVRAANFAQCGTKSKLVFAGLVGAYTFYDETWRCQDYLDVEQQ
jgi:hypothetical protein